MTAPFDPRVTDNDPLRRRSLLRMLAAAVAAVEPATAVIGRLSRRRNSVVIGDIALEVTGRVIILALGKAAIPMSRGALVALDGMDVETVIATDAAGAAEGASIWIGSHPIPTGASSVAGSALLAAAGRAGSGDVVLALISGGGSAIAAVPVPGADVGLLGQTTESLLAAGMPIDVVNAVRRRLSATADGGLAAAAAGADALISLVISDVPRDDPTLVASGPTLQAAATPLDHLPLRAEVLALLDRPREDVRSPRRHIVRVVADGATAAAAAAAEAGRLGHSALVDDRPLSGDAAWVGRDLAGLAVVGNGILIRHGETTVAHDGTGSGGRNQELALAAAISIAGTNGLVAALATDGVDGPTDAAGAVVDGATLQRGAALQLDAAAALAGHDSHPYLAATGDLLISGPTGTNVADLALAWSGSGR